MHLTLSAKIPGADKAKFEELAGMAKAGCPVSKLLNTKITLDATLLWFAMASPCPSIFEGRDRISHIRVAVGADGGDAHHVGGAGDAERHAGDDDDALAGPGKTVAERDAGRRG